MATSTPLLSERFSTGSAKLWGYTTSGDVIR